MCLQAACLLENGISKANSERLIMQRLIVFNSIAVDGYFTDKQNDMSFAHNPIQDSEWDMYVSGNASGNGTLIFGRVTYELMVKFWPTQDALDSMPEVAIPMNQMKKVVFSRTIEKADWVNTRLVKEDLPGEIKRMKEEPGNGLVILGSGSIVAQLAGEGLIDEYQFIVVPVILGEGRTLFEGLHQIAKLKLIQSRAFHNGNVLISYAPV
jgi:dihydrofolate reductase